MPGSVACAGPRSHRGGRCPDGRCSGGAACGKPSRTARMGLESPQPTAGEERLILRAPFAAPGRDLPLKPRMQITEHGLGFFAALLALALVGEVLVLRPIVSETEAPIAGID